MDSNGVVSDLEIESIENEHEQQKSEYRNYSRMLESKLKNA